jgi:hypothetical protein
VCRRWQWGVSQWAAPSGECGGLAGAVGIPNSASRSRNGLLQQRLDADLRRDEPGGRARRRQQAGGAAISLTAILAGLAVASTRGGGSVSTVDRQIMDTLRALADAGRTVVVVTHNVARVEARVCR